MHSPEASSYLVQRLIYEAQSFIVNDDPIPLDLMVKLECAGVDIERLRDSMQT